MKVIFLQSVPRVGKKDEVKNVNDGYAVNFLFPKKLAEPATSSAVAKLEQRKKEIAIFKEVEETLLIKNLEELKGQIIELVGKANDKGHLFKSIHKEEIVKALQDKHKASIDAQYIDLERPIKEIGEFKIPVRVKNKEGHFTLIVKAQ